MYAGVPNSSPLRDSAGSSRICAKPKSASRKRSPSTSTLAGFTSRCRMPCSCKCCSASARSAKLCAKLRKCPDGRASSGFSSRICRSSVCPSGISSWAINGTPSTSPAAKTSTKLACRTRAVTSASRWKRANAVGESPISGCSNLSATRRPSETCSASHTEPMPPRPSSRMRR